MREDLFRYFGGRFIVVCTGQWQPVSREACILLKAAAGYRPGVHVKR